MRSYTEEDYREIPQSIRQGDTRKIKINLPNDRKLIVIDNLTNMISF